MREEEIARPLAWASTVGLRGLPACAVRASSTLVAESFQSPSAATYPYVAATSRLPPHFQARVAAQGDNCRQQDSVPASLVPAGGPGLLPWHRWLDRVWVFCLSAGPHHARWVRAAAFVVCDVVRAGKGWAGPSFTRFSSCTRTLYIRLPASTSGCIREAVFFGGIAGVQTQHLWDSCIEVLRPTVYAGVLGHGRRLVNI
jgi:hypothetical protein